MRINHKPSETLGELLKLEMDELSTGGMIIRYGTDSLVHVFREGAVEIGKDYIAVEFVPSVAAPYVKTIIPLRMVREIFVTDEDEIIRADSAAGEGSSIGTVFAVGDKVFHQKFGKGTVTVIEGNKLTVSFENQGQKQVVDSFVEKV
jgi:PcrA/UvrD tudor domain